MKQYLNDIRKPSPLSSIKKLIFSFLIAGGGIMLGLLSKILDVIPNSELPLFLKELDLGNFFSRMGFWMFMGVLISIYSKSPQRAAVNVFLFFSGMISSYFFYTVNVLGFFPRSYLLFWVIFTLISPVLAFVCWYAKGKGPIAIFISAGIFLFLLRQTFAFGFWYVDLMYNLELLLLIISILILYQSPKQILKVISLGLVLFFLTAPFHIFGELL